MLIILVQAGTAVPESKTIISLLQSYIKQYTW